VRDPALVAVMAPIAVMAPVLVPAPLHPISRRHLDALTGELGIFQHAIGSMPDPAHGYCVDDVARALQVDLLQGRTLGWPAVADSAARSLRFLEEAFDEQSGRFRNFRDVDGSWLGGPGSNDSLGRAMLALGETVADAADPQLAARAATLFAKALPAAGKMTSPRAMASVVLGCAAAERSLATLVGATDDKLAEATRALMRRLGTDLHARFLWLARPGWPWLEDELTYENALLPRALIVTGDRMGLKAMLAIGLQVLDWLIKVQTAPEGHLSPIGNGWWPRTGVKSRFDQQPIEATALLLAADAAFRATGDARHLAAMERAYGWFLGANDLGIRIADPKRGAGADGLTPTGVNTNQGAESTLMWLMAAEHVRARRGERPQPVAVTPTLAAGRVRSTLAATPALATGPTLVASPR
jgi:hypothetical protein